MDRRGFVGCLLAGSLAGCSFSTDTGGPSYPRLGRIVIVNDAPEPLVVELRVSLDGEEVHRNSYEVPASGQTDEPRGRLVVGPSWPAESGEYYVEARFPDQSRWTPIDLVGVEPGADCVALQLRVEAGRLRWFTSDECQSSGGAEG